MTINHNKISMSDCVVVATGIVAMVLASLANLLWGTDILLIIVWLFFCCLIFVQNLQFALKYIHYIIFLSLNLIGVFIIDNNDIFLNELKVRSFDSDAFLPIVLIHFAFLIFLLLINKPILLNSDKETKVVDITINSRSVMNVILTVLGIVLAAMTLFLFAKAVSKPAFMLGYDRFEYSRAYITGSWEKTNKYISWFLPIIPLLLINNKKRLGWGILATYAVYQFLIGNKFGIFLSLLIMLTPYFYARFNLNNVTRKTVLGVLLIIAVLGCGLVLVLFIFHRLTYGYSFNDFKLYLYQRIAQQGQMWWAVYGKSRNMPWHVREIFDEVVGFWGIDTSSPHKMDFGIYKMMQYVTPYETYIAKILSGSRYTTSTCASIYYYFKFWGFIFFLPLSACVLSYCVNWYWRALYSNEIIGVIVSWTMIGRIATIYTMSEFQMIFNLKYLIIFIIAVCIDKFLIYRSREKKVLNMESLY